MPQRICCGISCLYGCLLSSDCQFDSLRMLLCKRLHIINHQHEIAAATSSRHLPGMNLRKDGILINEALYAALNHGREHGNLGIEGCLEGRCKGSKIHCEDSIPAVIGCLGKVLHLWLGNVLALYHRTARTAWIHRNHADMALHPRENLLIQTGFKLIRPETIIIIMSHQSRHADTDGILRTTHDTVAALRIVLETPAWQESQDSCQATSPAISS